MMRTLLLLLLLIHIITVSINFYHETCYCTAAVLRRHGCDGSATAVLVHVTAVMAVPRAIMTVPRRSHCGSARVIFFRGKHKVRNNFTSIFNYLFYGVRIED